MLVLSRRCNESILIGQAGDVLDGPIVVMVTDLRGDKARLGIAAPRRIQVHRQEVYAALQREHRRARGN